MNTENFWVKLFVSGDDNAFDGAGDKIQDLLRGKSAAESMIILVSILAEVLTEVKKSNLVNDQELTSILYQLPSFLNRSIKILNNRYKKYE